MQTLQIVIGMIVVIGLVFWTSAQFEDRKWRPQHLMLCRFLRERLPAGGPLRILAEFETRVWHGRPAEDNKSEMWGELPLAICLDAGLEDLRRLETQIVALRYELEQKFSIRLGNITLCIKEILPRLCLPGAEQITQLAAANALDTVPEGEFSVDITDKTLRRYIAWHVLLWQDGAADPATLPGRERDADKIFAGTRLQITSGKRIVVIRHQSRDDVQLAGYLERQIHRVFGSAWEVALHG